MKIIKQISIEEVVLEWLQAEWYKSYYDDLRKQYNYLVVDPHLTDSKENALRKDILFRVRHNIIAALYNLSVTWQRVSLETADIARLFIIPASDWYTITGKTFQLQNVPQQVEEDLVGHKASILHQLEKLQKGEKLNNKIIVIGSSEDNLTIIEGNHRMSALMMYLAQTKNIIYQQEVTIGWTQKVHRYRWSIKWEKIDEFMQLCKDENVSFNL